MNERTLSGLRAGLLVSIGVLLALVAGQFRERFLRNDRERLQDALERVCDLVDERYVYPIDRQLVVENAIAGIFSNLDQHSRYFRAQASEKVVRETRGTQRGIGAIYAPGASDLEVLFCLPDSPSERAGLRPGDRIVELDGRPVEDVDASERVHLLENERDDAVLLTVVGPDGPPRTVRVVPEEVDDPSVRHVQILDAEHGIGYLALTSFSRRTPAEFDTAVAALQNAGAKALVVDLRMNPGGVLRSAVRVANRFIGEGTIVISESRRGEELWKAEAGEDWYAELPLVVLVDRDSASASEVLAGALQDHRCGVLVGERTYGKGCVQTLTPLETLGLDGIVKLTTSVYRTPSGRLIERTLPGAWAPGLAPDLEVTIDDELRPALSDFLASDSPPLDHRAEIQRWQVDQPDRELLPSLPTDAQLEAALDLLRGERPGPYRS
jgi:carboxyl-terminal processing protease